MHQPSGWCNSFSGPRVSYNSFAPLLWYGNAAVKNDNVRINYSKEAATLQPGDKQARADLKEKYRAQMQVASGCVIQMGQKRMIT